MARKQEKNQKVKLSETILREVDKVNNATGNDFANCVGDVIEENDFKTEWGCKLTTKRKRKRNSDWNMSDDYIQIRPEFLLTAMDWMFICPPPKSYVES